MPQATARARTSRISSSRASSRARSTASRTVSAPVEGLPSMSPPIQVPKRSGAGASGISWRSARTTAGTACHSDVSKNHSPARISSTTRGRVVRTGSVCQRAVISAWSPATTRSRRSGVSHGSSSARRRRAMRWCAARTVRRAASVGCAVSTGSTWRLRAASASASPVAPAAASCRTASAIDSRATAPSRS